MLTVTNSRATDTEATRAKAIVTSLSEDQPSSEAVFAAFEELDGLPAEIVRKALGEWLKPLRLHVVAVVKDADVLDLGPIAEEQLRLAGKSFDGADLAAEDRLDGEIAGSFAGAIEHRVLAEAHGTHQQPLFDVLMYTADAGVVFRAGTTELIGRITYGSVETSDRRAGVAIQEALASNDIAEQQPPEPEIELDSEPETVALAPNGGGTAKEASSTTAPQGVAPKKAAKPKAATKTAKPKAATKTAKPKATTKTAKPKAATKTAKPKAATKTAKPKAATKATKPKAATKTAKPKAATKTAKPKAATKTAKPKAATKTAKPKAATKTAKPKAATKTAKPKAATKTAKPKARTGKTADETK